MYRVELELELDLSTFSDEAMKIAWEAIEAAANHLLHRSDGEDYNARLEMLQAVQIIDAISDELAVLAFADEDTTND